VEVCVCQKKRHSNGHEVNNDPGQHAPHHQTRIALTLLIAASYAVAP
jgi:hypothetical protein